MTREELEKEAKVYSYKLYHSKAWNPGEDMLVKAYLAGAEPREKRITELEIQIEKMKCCGNCHHHFFNSYDVMECAEGLNVTSKHCDKWEIKEK